MAELTYRETVAETLRREMEKDERVILVGEDLLEGGVFKTVKGLSSAFPGRVWNTPISETAILGAAMGAAMNGMRPVAEIMFADFVGVCYDTLVNQIPKFRYMSDGQIQVPLTIRVHNGSGVRFGAQHSQNIESWLMAIPGLKIAVPSTPQDVATLLRAAISDPDPVVVLEHKALLGTKGLVSFDNTDPGLGVARVHREGNDVVIFTIGAMVHRSLEAAERLQAETGIDATVVDLRTLIPLDARRILEEVSKHDYIFTVEENPRPCGWGAEVVSIIADEGVEDLVAPIRRITMPYIPVPASATLEDAARPSVEMIVRTIGSSLVPTLQ